MREKLAFYLFALQTVELFHVSPNKQPTEKSMQRSFLSSFTILFDFVFLL